MTNLQASSWNLRSQFAPHYGFGCHFVADNGRSFISEELKQLMQQLGSITTHTIGYNTQSNPVDRSHRSINEKLRISLEERNESHWLDYLPNVPLGKRTTPSTVSIFLCVWPTTNNGHWLDVSRRGDKNFSRSQVLSRK